MRCMVHKCGSCDMLTEKGTRAKTVALGRNFCPLFTKTNYRVVIWGMLSFLPEAFFAVFILKSEVPDLVGILTSETSFIW